MAYFRTQEKQTPLQHAISRHLPMVVEVLCQRNVDMNTMDHTDNCPLWQALDSGQEDIAHTLVSCHWTLVSILYFGIQSMRGI